MMMCRAAYSLLMVFSLAFLLFLGPAAACQEKSGSPAVEHKAVAFGTDEKANTKKLNELAADGWEYVGPLGNSMVAFKRNRVVDPHLAAKKELAKWEGSWEAEGDVKMTIKGDRFTSSTPTTGPRNGKLKVIEVREKVSLVDFVVEDGDVKGQTGRAILRLDGDTLHYCVTFSEARPTEFKTADENYYIPWKRVQK